MVFFYRVGVHIFAIDSTIENAAHFFKLWAVKCTCQIPFF